MDENTLKTDSSKVKTGSGFKIAIIISISAFVISAAALFIFWPNIVIYNKKRAAELEKQKPHKELLAQIAMIRRASKELKACPLIFPVLDGKGRLTPLGSYISYTAMIKTANIPGAKMSLPDVGKEFMDFRLFDPSYNPGHDSYIKQLPMRFNTRDFCKGTFIETKDGYNMTVQFWNSSKVREYNTDFNGNSIHTAPDWIAQCAMDWLGNTLQPAQKAYLQAPVFRDESSFLKCARTEYIERNWPELISGTDALARKEVDNLFVKSRLLSLYKSTDADKYFSALNSMAKDPEMSGLLQCDTIAYAAENKKGPSGMKIMLDLIMKDNNNAYLYENAVDLCNFGNYQNVGVELVKTWRGLHPENKEVWLRLSLAYRQLAWYYRGKGYANSVQSDAWKYVKKYIAEDVKAAKRAAKLAPEDSRTWGYLLAAGIGASTPKKMMFDYFNKAISLNPHFKSPYTIMCTYLMPKWSGSDEEVMAFYRQHYVVCPVLINQPATESFWFGGPYNYQGSEETRKTYVDSIKQSVYLDDYKKIMPLYFAKNPLDRKIWRDYFHWMSLLGLRKEALETAEKVIPADEPELKALYPSLVLMAVEEDIRSQATQKIQSAMEKDSGIKKLREKMYRELIKADDNNWIAWNKLAKLYMDNKNKKEAIKCIKKIGNNDKQLVWGSDGFYDAKVELGMAKPIKKIAPASVNGWQFKKVEP